jgi:DNA-binding NarL/FixJ family response regulator
MKILIADDHALVRQSVKSLLLETYPTLTISEVSDSNQLYAKLSSETYDVVISDFYMPGPPVTEVIKTAREKGITTPVIILTLSQSEDFVTILMKNEVSAFITKNNIFEELIKAMQSVLMKRNYISTNISTILANPNKKNLAAGPHKLLSEKEMDIFVQMACNKDLSMIAEELGESISSVCLLKTTIMRKLHLHTKAEIINYATNYALL